MNLFAYGTLMDPEIFRTVCGGDCRSANGILQGYTRRKVIGEEYPGTVALDGCRVEGRVYFDVPRDGWNRLDAFEGPMYSRKRVPVVVAGGKVEAWVYVVRPGWSNRLSEEDWSFESFLAKGKETFKLRYVGFDRMK
ncbi:MAG: gamma-glutamylcyclotransferase [bacterium]|nr:gamma-glutamylcyclotransferase [bacterium]